MILKDESDGARASFSPSFIFLDAISVANLRRPTRDLISACQNDKLMKHLSD